MADHSELVTEMLMLEQMGSHERQKLAKKRRLQQLKRWAQREREWLAKEKQLNKRLANTLQEENNGLNLKQYTLYNSNQRPKNKFQRADAPAPSNGAHKFSGNTDNAPLAGAANGTNSKLTSNNNTNTNNTQSNGPINGANNSNNNNNIGEYLDKNKSAPLWPSRSAGLESSSLAPNGRVHFDVGVMLLEAAARNDYDEVKRLLMLGVSPDSVNHDGLTALHQCCIDASEPIMNLLLEFGANVDARDTEHWTPLHAACTCGHLKLVEILVNNGANLLAVNGDGNMPFDICEDEATLDYIESEMVKQEITQEMIDSTRASSEMQMISDLEKLVAQGGDLNEPLSGANRCSTATTPVDGVTPLHIAAANGYVSVVRFLIKHGADVNVCDSDEWRPIHGAACWGNEQHLRIVELLVEAGASLDVRTINDETPFDLCDNAQLLERMNQLKDEVESKQASGIDRLRRTQSRTNSRVRSIRRTSVRDKNQISRRDAREEALIRVESEPKLAPASGATVLAPANAMPAELAQQQQQQAVNGKAAKSGSDCAVDAVDGPTLGRPSNEGKQTNNATRQPADGGAGSAMNVTGAAGADAQSDRVPTSNGSERARAPLWLDHDQEKAGPVRRPAVGQLVSVKMSSNENGLDIRSKSAVVDPTSTTTASSSSATDAVFDSTVDRHQSAPSLRPTEPASSGPSSSNCRRSPKETWSQATLVAPDGRQLDAANNGNANHHHHHQASEQQQPQVIQLAPINYTLANLKKQRSDLRMRVTTIGVVGGNNGTVAVQARAANGALERSSPPPPLILDGCSHAAAPETPNKKAPKKGALITKIEINPSGPKDESSRPQAEQTQRQGRRPESPSGSFRTFRGEPSEVIGDGERKLSHACCSLM